MISIRKEKNSHQKHPENALTVEREVISEKSA